jgi:hypothetical protein
VTSASHVSSREGTRPTPWENCFLSVLLIGIFPLAPVLLEGLLKGEVTVGALTITAAIYAVTVAIASYRAILFMSGFLVALAACALYGQDVTINPVKSPASVNYAGITISSGGSSRPAHAGLMLLVIVALFVTLATERYFRHVKDREEFFEFLKKGEH